MERFHDTMDKALALAERGWGRVSPNPMVGAVVLAPGGEVLGEGWHEGPGSEHAEVMALGAAGAGARGATVVVTLEPCDRWGRTPPCTRALIEVGVARVVVAATDPNLGDEAPGLAELEAAGIDVITDIRGSEARRMNAAFETHVRTGRPFVVLKSASSLDGKTAASDGSSKWITSEEARADAQHLRAWADAIVVGSRTVLEDDPALTVREPAPHTSRAPLRVLVDTAGRVPATGRLFDGAAPTLVATTDHAADARVTEWESAGAEVTILPRERAGGVSLDALLDHLGKRDVQGLLIEGGATLAWSFVRDDLVDRVVLYLAPKLLGGATSPGVVMGGGFAPVDLARMLEFERVERIGPDLKVEARVHRDR